jgi:6-phosphogluconolactonase (cycloisomerase 2 family)
MKRLLLLAGIGFLALCGCGKFFVPQNSTGTGTTTTNTNAGDVIYTANATGITAYTVSSSGALTAVSGSPYSVAPTAMAITPGNTDLYVASISGIFGYGIGTNGVLTALSTAALETDATAVTSMIVDTTGNFLLASGVDATTLAPAIWVYEITPSTGALAELTQSPFAVGNGNGSSLSAISQLYMAPNDQFLYLVLGAGGTEILTFDNSSGIVTDSGSYQALLAGGTAQVGVTANSGSTLLFITETGEGVRVFNIDSSTGQPSAEIAGSPFAAGTGPSGLTLNAAGTDLYVANKGSGNISAFSVASTGTVGTLKAISGSPFTAGANPLTLTLDQSGNFLAVANLGGSPDVDVYSMNATTAALASVSSETSTSPNGSFLVVATHPTD